MLPVGQLFIEFETQQFRCPECQVQGKPGARITDIAPNQLADPP